MTLFDVCNRTSAVVDCIQEVKHLKSRSGGSINVDALFCDIFGILLFLEHYVEMYFLSVPQRHKITLRCAGIQRSLFSIKRKSPGVVGIRRCTPSAMLPHAVEFFVFEISDLRVFDVSLCCFLDINPARRCDSLGPSKLQHPAYRVEHVNAHVAHDTISILLEGTPPPQVRQT